MKLIGMFLVRNESWVLDASIQAALRWCDGVCLLDDDSTDATRTIVRNAAGKYKPRFHHIEHKRTSDDWNEMILRQHLFEEARRMGGTHYAIIDADEILTANLVDKIRPEFEKLALGQCLEVPMLAMRTLDVYQDDSSVWSSAWLTLGFADKPELTWRPAEDGYQHHARAPRGNIGSRRYLRDKSEGGGMHLQFSNRRRLVAKHWLYAYVDHLRWPDRETPQQLSAKYNQALMKAEHLGVAHEEWWVGHDKKSIKLDGVPWQEDELRKLIVKHGEAAFEGIKLSEKRPV